MNVFTFSVNFVCLLFWAFLAGVYFSQKKMNNYENKLYKRIIILDFLLLFSHFIAIIIGYYFVHDVNEIPFIYVLIAKIYSASQMGWCLYFTYYMLVAVNETNKKFNDWFYSSTEKKFKTINCIAYAICFLDFLLPANYLINKNNVVVFTGIRVDFVTYSMLVLAIIILIAIIKNRKNINIRKVIPFAFLVVSQLTALFAYIKDPSVSIFTLSITLISYFMYHTIENPDIKIISELQLATEQAEKSNNAKSDFLNSISKDMKTPINTILRLTQNIEDVEELEIMHNNGEKILNESHKLMELVEGILAINSLSADEVELVETEYSPKEVYEAIIKLSNIRLGDKNIELKTNYSEELPDKLIGDKEKLKRIITNVVYYSIKNTEEGNVTFDMSCLKEKDKCILQLTISDTGKGMTEEEKSQILKSEFVDINNNDTDKELDSEITKSLVNLMKGKISFDSTLGQGSIFKIEIPQKYNN